jgi:hypothetical protein
MRRWERKRSSDLPTNRAMIRVVRHDQTERLAPHKICEYLACSPILNVLVVECSGGNSRPSCPSGVGGGTLGNRKIASSVAGQIPNRRRLRSDTSSNQLENSCRTATALPRSAPSRSGCRPCSTCAIFLNARMLPHVLVGAHPAKRSGPAIGQR